MIRRSWCYCLYLIRILYWNCLINLYYNNMHQGTELFAEDLICYPRSSTWFFLPDCCVWVVECRNSSSQTEPGPTRLDPWVARVQGELVQLGKYYNDTFVVKNKKKEKKKEILYYNRKMLLSKNRYYKLSATTLTYYWINIIISFSCFKCDTMNWVELLLPPLKEKAIIVCSLFFIE